MPFEVIIIRNSDGKQVTYIDSDNWDEGSQFRWTEGNQACDCNRALMFARLSGESIATLADNDPPCGNTVYSVILPEKPKEI